MTNTQLHYVGLTADQWKTVTETLTTAAYLGDPESTLHGLSLTVAERVRQSIELKSGPAGYIQLIRDIRIHSHATLRVAKTVADELRLRAEDRPNATLVSDEQLDRLKGLSIQTATAEEILRRLDSKEEFNCTRPVTITGDSGVTRTFRCGTCPACQEAEKK